MRFISSALLCIISVLAMVNIIFAHNQDGVISITDQKKAVNHQLTTISADGGLLLTAISSNQDAAYVNRVAPNGTADLGFYNFANRKVLPLNPDNGQDIPDMLGGVVTCVAGDKTLTFKIGNVGFGRIPPLSSIVYVYDKTGRETGELQLESNQEFSWESCVVYDKDSDQVFFVVHTIDEKLMTYSKSEIWAFDPGHCCVTETFDIDNRQLIIGVTHDRILLSDGSSFETLYLLDLDSHNSTPITLPQDTGVYKCDGSEYIYFIPEDNYELHRYNVYTKNEEKIVDDLNMQNDPSLGANIYWITKDDHLIFALADDVRTRLYITDLTTGEIVEVTDLLIGQNRFIFGETPDYFILYTGDKSVPVIDSINGQEFIINEDVPLFVLMTKTNLYTGIDEVISFDDQFYI